MTNHKISPAQHELLGCISENEQLAAAAQLDTKQLLHGYNPRSWSRLVQLGLAAEAPNAYVPCLTDAGRAALAAADERETSAVHAATAGPVEPLPALAKEEGTALHWAARGDWGTPAEWRRVPYLVRLRLRAKGFIVVVQGAYMVTTAGVAARERQLADTMGAGYRARLRRDDVDTAPYMALHAAVERHGGYLNFMISLEDKQHLRSLGLSRPAEEDSVVHLVTAPAYVLLDRTDDLAHLVRRAAGDWHQVLKGRRTDLEDNDDRTLHRAQRDRYCAAACPPGVEPTEFMRLVDALARERRANELAQQQLQQRLYDSLQRQQDLLRKADLLRDDEETQP